MFGLCKGVVAARASNIGRPAAQFRVGHLRDVVSL